ncbi:hypothetical protein N665_5678s0002 [Sinapis alba]|nr:hypothetical protein N665_5678s0002 [Sinapis alba]
MGRYLTKRMMFLLLTLIILLPLLISSSSGAPPVNSNKNGVSIAKEGRFPSSESEGKLPKLADLEFEDLNLCSLATYGEAVKDCLDLFEGIQSGTLHMCASFCDRVFEACSDAYFSSNATNQVIVPCGASETIICGKASKWESNGTTFCYALGFTVQTAEDSAQEPCHGSKSSLEPPVAVVKEPLIKTEFLALLISWLVTVLVLQTMLLKRWRDQQQMRAMIQRMRQER